MNKQCNVCNKIITGKENKEFQFGQATITTQLCEKIIFPKLSAKYPTQCAKLKTLISEFEALDKELYKTDREKAEEVIWKFHCKKGKLILPDYRGDGRVMLKLCQDCSSELETLVPFALDKKFEIIEKFEPILKQPLQSTDEYNSSITN